jgi:uncharacterized membrane protein
MNTLSTSDTRMRLALISIMGVLGTAFVFYAMGFGLRGLSQDLSQETHLYTTGASLANGTIFTHMLAGAVITLLAPLQLIGPLRRRYPQLHRASGYVFFSAALFTALAGLSFIVLKRTIGGPVMDVAFALYGACVLVCSVQTVRAARAKHFAVHREWALRIFVLAMGSWLYRMQYGVWFALMGDWGIGENFSGPFDYFQDFAFFVPYLIGVEVFLRWERQGQPRFPAAAQHALTLLVIAALMLGSYVFFPIFFGQS